MSAALKLKQLNTNRYTYSDYCEWDDDERWELIDGVPYAMAAPTRFHQGISGSIYYQIYHFLRGKACEVYYAPFDVRLNIDKLDNTVVQPDIVVFCDESKMDDKGGIGAPDMVIEILSPSSASHDTIRKYMLYMQVGVREYWIVDPATKTVVVHILEESTYRGRAFSETDKVPVTVLEGCEVNLAEVFGE